MSRDIRVQTSSDYEAYINRYRTNPDEFNSVEKVTLDVYQITGELQDIVFPRSCTRLQIHGGTVPQLNRLPPGLTCLDLELCSTIGDVDLLPRLLPETLKTLTVVGCDITHLPTLPFDLKVLNVSNNKLKSLPILPPRLVECDLTNNQLQGIPYFPSSLEKLRLFSKYDEGGDHDDDEENPFDDEYEELLEGFSPPETDYDSERVNSEQYFLNKEQITRLNKMCEEEQMPHYVKDKNRSNDGVNSDNLTEFIILSNDDLDYFLDRANSFRNLKKLAFDGIDFNGNFDGRTVSQLRQKIPGSLTQLCIYDFPFKIRWSSLIPAISPLSLKYLTFYEAFEDEFQSIQQYSLLPVSLIGIEIRNNTLPMLEINSSFSNLKYLNCSENSLHSYVFQDLPSGLLEIVVNDNPNFSFAENALFTQIEVLNCTNTRVDRLPLPYISDNLKELHFSHTLVRDINLLPDSLNVISCYGNKRLPPGLKRIIKEAYDEIEWEDDLDESENDFAIYKNENGVFDRLVREINQFEVEGEEEDVEDDDDDDDDDDENSEGDVSRLEQQDNHIESSIEDDDHADEDTDDDDDDDDQNNDDDDDQNNDDADADDAADAADDYDNEYVVDDDGYVIETEEQYDAYVIDKIGHPKIILSNLTLENFIMYEGTTELEMYDCTIKSPIKTVNSLIDFAANSSTLNAFPMFFDSLQKFHVELCDFGENIELPKLPDGLMRFSMLASHLKKLPNELPKKLEFLNCDYNILTALPELPDSLKELSVSTNDLTALPELPDSLNKLHVENNHLESLGKIVHTNLTDLVIGNNELTDLPLFPPTLKRLDWTESHSAGLSRNRFVKELDMILDRYTGNTANSQGIKKINNFLKSVYYSIYLARPKEEIIAQITSGDFDPTYLNPFIPETSLLMFLIKTNFPDEAAALIQSGNYYPEYVSPSKNENALLTAVFEETPEIALQLSLDGKCKVGIVNMDGFTPLIVACANGMADVVQVLVQRGKECLPEQITVHGINALSAALESLPELADDVFNLEPNACLIDHEGVLDFAKNANLLELVEKIKDVIQKTYTCNVADYGFDAINAENKKIKAYLDESPDNLCFKIGNSYFLVSKNTIAKQAKVSNNIKYACRVSSNNLAVAISDTNVIFDEVYLSMNSIFSLSAVVNVNTMMTAMPKSQDAAYNHRIFVLVKVGWVPGMMSVAYHRGEIGASADHCASGKDVFIFNLIYGILVDEEATVVNRPANSVASTKSPNSLERGEKVKVMVRNVTYEIAILDGTTIGELKENVANVVKSAHPDIEAKGITLIYSGKMYKSDQDGVLVKSVPGFIPGMTFLSRVLVSGGGSSGKSLKHAFRRMFSAKDLKKILKMKTIRRWRGIGNSKTYKRIF